MTATSLVRFTTRPYLGRPRRAVAVRGRLRRPVGRPRLTTQACVGFPATPSFQHEVDIMLELGTAMRGDPEKPRYHVMPRHGWINDPNGPVYYNGKYHLFYQHIINGCEWDFGIVWGHATSTDLVHWEHCPPALLPTPGGVDADGCFSGCCVVDTDGRPIILYTGVRLRSNPECGSLPPPECDLNLPFIETQCGAIADHTADDYLTTWHKTAEAVIALPPPNMPLVGWRDPYIFERKGIEGNGREWGMLMGTGLKGKGGAVMIYRSESLTSGWRYDGMLCVADTIDTGVMWECPLLAKLPVAPATPRLAGLAGLPPRRSTADGLANGSLASSARDGAAGKERSPAGGAAAASKPAPGSPDPADMPTSLLTQQLDSLHMPHPKRTHLLCISPDAPTNPVLYFLGEYDEAATRFLLDTAVGPFRLDLGDVLYAPNLLLDQQGRQVLWGWLQERRKVGSYDYAGCLSVPRLLSLRGDRLVQEPAPEVASLRRGAGWRQGDLTIFPEEATPLEGPAGPALDIECTIERGEADAAGLLFRSWNAGGEGSAALVYDWERSVLEVIFEGGQAEELGGAQPQLEPDNQRRVGGPVDLKPGEPLQMRILLDHSCLEVYLATGEVLSTRIYRGAAPLNADAGIDFVAYGGCALVARVEAWEVGTIWRRDSPQAAQQLLDKERAPAARLDTIYEPVTSLMPVAAPVGI